jgi:two-component sensor histidine kinase
MRNIFIAIVSKCFLVAWQRHIWFIACLQVAVCCILLLSSCNPKPLPKTISKKEEDRFYNYLDTGDSIYALRNHLNNFAESMRYFDSAVAIAEQYDIDSLKRDAYVYVAKGYDAWNQDPYKTVYYYGKAIEYGNKINDTSFAMYTSVLWASSYSKTHDSIGTINAIKKVESTYKNSLYDNDYVELAYTAAMVKNYAYALELSKKIRRPEKIADRVLNYKAHQTLTQCMLYLYYLHTDMPAWIDSTKNLIAHSDNLSDSVYYYTFLIEAYTYLNIKDSIAKYYNIRNTLDNKFGNKLDRSDAKNSFLEYEVKEADKTKTEAEREKEAIKKETLVISLITGLLLVIVFIVLFNRKSIAKKNKELALMNKQLDEKANQNLLLVKEMHHRVKNNLHMIYSLLDMQGRKTGNAEAKKQLQSARQRIESIAVTHEQLYINKEEGINMHAYISDFTNNIVSTLADIQQIVPVITIDKSIVLNTFNCLPLAMLINELITNTAKYAQPDDASDKMYIYINAGISKNTITLTYHDSGGTKGIPTVIKEGFGSKIIGLLCKQLSATLVTDDGNKPFHYKISFAND